MSLTKRQFTTNNGLVKKEKKNIEYETCDVWEDGEMEKQESFFSPEVYCKPSLELEHFNFREMSYQFCIFRFYFIFVMKSKVLMKNRWNTLLFIIPYGDLGLTRIFFFIFSIGES